MRHCKRPREAHSRPSSPPSLPKAFEPAPAAQRLEGLLVPFPAAPPELPHGGEVERPLGLEGADVGAAEEVLVVGHGGHQQRGAVALDEVSHRRELGAGEAGRGPDHGADAPEEPAGEPVERPAPGGQGEDRHVVRLPVRAGVLEVVEELQDDAVAEEEVRFVPGQAAGHQIAVGEHR